MRQGGNEPRGGSLAAAAARRLLTLRRRRQATRPTGRIPWRLPAAIAIVSA